MTYLQKKKYTDLVKNIIKNTKETVNFKDKIMLWEYLKCEIRSQTTLFAGQRSRENAKIEKSLKARLEISEKKSIGFKLHRVSTAKRGMERDTPKKIMVY